jgi:hypothetical protein
MDEQMLKNCKTQETFIVFLVSIIIFVPHYERKNYF